MLLKASLLSGNVYTDLLFFFLLAALVCAASWLSEKDR